jgi:hypothetical protein
MRCQMRGRRWANESAGEAPLIASCLVMVISHGSIRAAFVLWELLQRCRGKEPAHCRRALISAMVGWSVFSRSGQPRLERRFQSATLQLMRAKWRYTIANGDLLLDKPQRPQRRHGGRIRLAGFVGTDAAVFPAGSPAKDTRRAVSRGVWRCGATSNTRNLLGRCQSEPKRAKPTSLALHWPARSARQECQRSCSSLVPLSGAAAIGLSRRAQLLVGWPRRCSSAWSAGIEITPLPPLLSTFLSPPRRPSLHIPIPLSSKQACLLSAGQQVFLAHHRLFASLLCKDRCDRHSRSFRLLLLVAR